MIDESKLSRTFVQAQVVAVGGIMNSVDPNPRARLENRTSMCDLIIRIIHILFMDRDTERLRHMYKQSNASPSYRPRTEEFYELEHTQENSYQDEVENRTLHCAWDAVKSLWDFVNFVLKEILRSAT